MVRQKIAHHAVLKRMETDHCQATARREQRQRLREHALQLAEFIVDPHAQRLEGACRGVLAGLARRHGALDELGQLPRAQQGPDGAFAFDGVGDAAREAFLPEGGDHAAHFLARGPGQPVTDGFAALRVHAHVERSVLLETETARRIVELR